MKKKKTKLKKNKHKKPYCQKNFLNGQIEKINKDKW